MPGMTQDEVENILDGGDGGDGGTGDDTGKQNPPDPGDGTETAIDDGDGGDGGEDDGETPPTEKKVQLIPPPTEKKPAEDEIVDEFSDLEELEDFKEPEVKAPAPGTPEAEGEIATPASAVQLHKDLKEKFPEALKQFPQLRSAIFKAAQYEQFYPTVQDAQEAAAISQVYNQMEVEVSKGNIAPIINSLRKNAPEALKSLAQGFMETLGDRELQNIAAEPVIRGALQQMLTDAVNTRNKNLELTAKYAINWLYGVRDGKLPPPVARGAKEDPLAGERATLQQERATLAQQRFHNVQQPIIADTEDSVVKYIGKHIDPDKKMTEFTRDAAVKRVFDELTAKLVADPGHMRRITHLWNQIRQNPSLAASLGPEIRRAFAGSAKPHLPTLISAARAKALGVTGKAPTPGNPKRQPVLAGGGSGRVGVGGNGGVVKGVSLGNIKPSDINYDKTSEDDILNGKVTLKRQSR